MNRFSHKPIIQSTVPIIRIRFPISVLPHNFFFTAASISAYTLLQEPDSEDTDSGQVSGVIQDKDLLKKTQNGKLLILDLIDRGAVEPDARLYHQLLKRCTDLGKLKEGQMVHALVSNSKFNHYVATNNTLINMYARCKDLIMARTVFDKMPVKDMVSYTVLITGYSQNNEPENALELYLEMVRNGLRPNQFTFGSVLKAAASLQNDGMGRGVHGTCVKIWYEKNVYVGSALVDMYARCGKMAEALVMFEGLERMNEVPWNALVAAYARKGEGENAVRLFAEMKRDGFQPTNFTYSSVFLACASIGALDKGKWVHADMLKSGLKLIAFVGNTLLDMYGKAGNIEDAKKVFDRLAKRDLVSWNSMLTAYAQHGLGKETVEGFEDLCRMGFHPNEVSFLCVLNACSHAGLLDKGLYYFEMMKEFKIEPEISHYVAIVDLLGRAGQLDRAVSFIQEMKIESTAALWKALLGACRMHKNMELGAYAAERVFELDPYDSGPHVLLSNMYASAGKWNKAAEVRKIMNEIGVKKEPACSWVEIENVVHIFVANDTTHPQSVEIRRMWEKIANKIKKIGYVPDTTHALWGANEQEKEEMLQNHSEKLALAFVLLNTPSGSPIRIKKNIRVCGDCHAAFKFVSVVESREMILRDTNRFHHFRDGNCSCGDYW